MTLADIIRLMSDKELAQYLTSIELRVLKVQPLSVSRDTMYHDWLEVLSSDVDRHDREIRGH